MCRPRTATPGMVLLAQLGASLHYLVGSYVVVHLPPVERGQGTVDLLAAVLSCMQTMGPADLDVVSKQLIHSHHLEGNPLASMIFCRLLQMTVSKALAKSNFSTSVGTFLL